MIILRVTRKEAERIKKRMRQAGVKNKSAFIRKMATDGFIVKLDLKDVKELTRLLRICSNNLNQYAKVANALGHIHEADIRDLRTRLDELLTMTKEIMRKLAAIM